jgi:hypothetical protein
MAHSGIEKLTQYCRSLVIFRDVELDLYRPHRAKQSHPVDLGQSANRLRDVSTASISSEEEQLQENLRRESRNYYALVDDGGRPSHPLGRLEDIAMDPGEFREILSFWQSWHLTENNCGVFENQLSRWEAFRALQRFARMARGPSHFDYIRGLVEEKRTAKSSEAPEYHEDRSYDEGHLHQFGKSLYLLENHILWEAFVRRNGQVVEQQGFSEYAEALKQRLAKLGFTKTFQLRELLARQDKITTWIEYFGFECWWYEHYTDVSRHQQKLHDKAWYSLVRSNVLWPGETEDFICNVDSGLERESEEEKAVAALQSARTALSSLETFMGNSRGIQPLPRALQQLWSEKRSELENARQEYKSIKWRNSSIDTFLQQIRKPAIAKRTAERHRVLLHWILQQFPLIETEANPPNPRGSDRQRGKKMRNRKRSALANEEQRLEQRRADEGASSSVPNRLPVVVIV